MKLTPFVLSLCLAAATYSAHADTITTLTAAPANANDAVLYLPQLGSDGDNVNSGVTALSNNGITTTITFSPAGSVNLCDQYYDTCGAALPNAGGSLFASGTSVTYTFSSGVSAFGTTFIDLSSLGSDPNGSPVIDTASLALYNGTTLLGTVTASESFGGQFYFGGSDTSGADITSAVLSVTAENITTSYASYGGPAYDPSPSCASLGNQASNFDTSTTQGITNILTCPRVAVRYVALYHLALPSGFCTSNASACSAFEQQGGSISPSGPIGFTEGFQADSLDLVDGTPAAANLAATPEPSSLALLGTGILAAAGAARRRILRS